MLRLIRQAPPVNGGNLAPVSTSGLYYGGFQKFRVPLLEVPIRRTIVFGGLYWGPLFVEITTKFLGNNARLGGDEDSWVSCEEMKVCKQAEGFEGLWVRGHVCEIAKGFLLEI